MATGSRAIRLQPDAYELLAREAARRGVEPDQLADELVRHRLLGRYDPHVRRRRSQRARRHAALRYRAHDKLMRALLYDDLAARLIDA